MLFTKASEYAMLSLIYISQKSSPVDVDTMSNELGISKSFLAKILQSLAKEGVLISFKGANGGFLLADVPENISIKKIIESAEKRKTAVFECSISHDDCPTNKGAICQIWSTFNALQIQLDDFLDTIKLSDIIKK
ncbi:Rrf2 family transcriptional regulator [Campylobacter sp. RM16187]|uniref:Rrf2 family transcriptional regulator n=1 Tax=Campylobacter sp. RM16187 TaxID=1660063 RepID=UPI0021B55F35|nr:Rrf2 family transcriptional regulator [Campylobacter sp. RM16187]QKG29065.1 transcriptional regulator, BadM/Rrf2 family [Campylobacter sp. RM16187]